MCIRPEALEIVAHGTSPETTLRGRVVHPTYLGNRVDYLVQIGTLTVRVEAPATTRLPAGAEVSLAVRSALVYPDSTSATMPSGDATA